MYHICDAGFAAQSLIAALSSIQFVTNVICVIVIHKQHVAQRVILSTVLIILGNILLVIFSSKDSPLYSIDELRQLWKEIPYVIYLGAATLGKIV